MTLVKKTIILSKNGAKGYVTVVRVGGTIGVKAVIDEKEAEMTLALKIGSGKLLVRTISGQKTEFELGEDVDFKSSDEISCLILRGGDIYAEGGVRGRIRIQDVADALPRKDPQPSVKSRAANGGEQKAIKKEVMYGSGEKKPNLSEQAQRDMEKVRDEASTAVRAKEEGVAAVDKTADSPPKSETKSAPDVRSFYFSVKDKLDELFVMYPHEETLEKIIPSSKWVKISYDKEDYYVAGVLTDDGAVTHIAYGVPGYEGKSPPKETECICDWLPIKNMPKFQGYWLIFQNAETGKLLPKD